MIRSGPRVARQNLDHRILHLDDRWKETDTGRTWRWTGNRWVPLPPVRFVEPGVAYGQALVDADAIALPVISEDGYAIGTLLVPAAELCAALGYDYDRLRQEAHDHARPPQPEPVELLLDHGGG